MTSTRRVRRRLESAIPTKAAVRVTYKEPKLDGFHGIVHRVGRRWVVLTPLVDGHEDGLVAVRMGAIASVEEETGSLFTRFSALQPGFPWTPTHEIDCTDVTSILATLAGPDELIGIESLRWPNAMPVGVIDEVTDRWLWLTEIRPDATWQARPIGSKLKPIDIVSSGCRYFSTLQTVSDLLGGAPGIRSIREGKRGRR